MITKALLLAMISVESGGNPAAVSSRDAKGLMQITEIAVKEVCSKHQCPPGLDMFDPEDNVWVGYLLLDHYLEIANGDMTGALILYNGGYRQYNRYLSGEDMTAETVQYVKLVKYKRTYYAGFFARQPWIKPSPHSQTIDSVLSRMGAEDGHILFDAWL